MSKITHCITCLILLAQLTSFAAGIPKNLIGVLKLPPLKALTVKSMMVARTIHPGQQTEILPLFLLGSLGYPNYPGVSETDNVSAFLLETQTQKPAVVILAKIAQDSPLRQTASSLKWELQDYKEWVLLAKTHEAFQAVGDIEALIALNAEPTDFDVTLRVFLDAERVKHWVASLKPKLETNHLAQENTLDFFAQALENLTWLELGTRLSKDTISLGFSTKAIPGTPEGQLLSASAGGKVPIAQQIPAEGMLFYQGQIAPAALQAYSNALVERALKLTSGKTWGLAYSQMLSDYLKMGDGTYAGQMTRNAEQLGFTSLTGGQYNEKEVLRLADLAYNQLLPQLFQKIPFFTEDGINYQFTLKQNVGTVGPIPIHSTTLSLEQATSTSQKANDPPVTEEQVTYFAVVKGLVLNTSTMAEMKTLVQDVQAGKPVKKNIASAFTPKSGSVFQYQVNIADYASLSLDALTPNNPEIADWAKAIEELNNTPLAPATGAVTLGNNQLQATIDIPLTSLARINQAIQQTASLKNQPSEQEQPTPQQPQSQGENVSASQKITQPN